MNRSAASIALALTLAPLAGLDAQATLRGRVVHDSSSRPLAGVAVTIEGKRRTAITDDSGRYVLGDLKPGRTVVSFGAVGFRPVRMQIELVKSDTSTLDARLLPEGVRLPAVEVKAKEPRGFGAETFEERRKLGIGRFLDSAFLRRAEGRRLSDLFAGIGEVKVVAGPVCTGSNIRDCVADRRSRFAINARMQIIDHCFMALIVDGSVLFRGGDVPWDAAIDINTWTVDRLQGVEVYAIPGEVPMEYGGTNATCGAILFWNKH